MSRLLVPSMKRLLATLRLEVVNQYRQGFYFASAVVLLFIAGFFSMLPAEAGYFMPAFLLTNMTIATFVFVGGMVLLEKDQGVLESLVVSPLRGGEYLLSKVITLSAMGVVENAVLVMQAIAMGKLPQVHWGWILIASLVTAALYVLWGFLTVVRFDSLNEFLLPMIGATIVLEAPAFIYFGLPDGFWYYLIPTKGPLLLFQAAVKPIAVWEIVYALIYPALWIGAAFYLGRRSLHRVATHTIGT